MARNSFEIVMWRAPQAAADTAWAQRVAGVLGALEAHAGVERFVRYDERRVAHEVATDEEAVLAFLRSHPTSRDDAGVPHPEVGIETTLIGLGDGESLWCQAEIHVGDERSKNNLSVDFYEHVGPQAPFEAFSACVSAFSPMWASVTSLCNRRQRRDEGDAPPISAQLHWRTYLGPGRAGEIDPAAVAGREDVLVRPLHKGVEVILGERWESDEVLRQRQRELEPLLLGERTPAR